MWRKGLYNRLCRIGAFVVSVIALVQCSRLENVVVYQDVDLREWCEPAEVVLSNQDVSAEGDLSIALHVNHTFSADTLGVEVIIHTPDSLRYSECVVAPVVVEWSGDKSGAVDVLVPYRRDVHLVAEGDYVITIKPLMPLRGVEAAGVNFQRK